MRPIQRRVAKLEVRLLPQPETWETRRLRERIESGRNRVAAARGGQFPSMPTSFSNRSIVEILNEGRMRTSLLRQATV
jgi:hypothetical protein